MCVVFVPVLCAPQPRARLRSLIVSLFLALSLSLVIM